MSSDNYDQQKEEELPPITEEEISLLLQNEELTPELQDLIHQYQQATASEDLKENQDHVKEEEEHVCPIGSHVAITFSFEKYELLLLPAVILSYSTTEEAQTLILTPVTPDTTPCADYFGRNNCSTTRCPYSHGYTVPTDFILPYEALELDDKLDHLQYGKKVWCKKEGDELWKLGNIIDQLHGHRWRVRLKKGRKRNIINVDLDHIMPFKSLCDDDSDDDEKEEWSESDRESVDDIIVTTSHGRLNDWGSWQVHTTGFAAKMMKKMGYVEGKGLGMDGEGRIDPIEAQPYYNSNQQNSRPGLGLKREKKKTTKKSTDSSKKSTPPPEDDMFGLMNTLLGNTKSDKKVLPSSPAAVVQPATRQQTNQTIAQLQSKLDKAQSEYIKATEGFRRNRGSPMETQFSTKLKNATFQLESLKKQMSQLQHHVKSIKEKQDMYTF